MVLQPPKLLTLLAWFWLTHPRLANCTLIRLIDSLCYTLSVWMTGVVCITKSQSSSRSVLYCNNLRHVALSILPSHLHWVPRFGCSKAAAGCQCASVPSPLCASLMPTVIRLVLYLLLWSNRHSVRTRFSGRQTHSHSSLSPSSLSILPGMETTSQTLPVVMLWA